MVATDKMIDLELEFENQLVERANRVRATKPRYEPPPRTVHISTHHRHHCHDNSGDDESQSGMFIFGPVNCLCFTVGVMTFVRCVRVTQVLLNFQNEINQLFFQM